MKNYAYVFNLPVKKYVRHIIIFMVRASVIPTSSVIIVKIIIVILMLYVVLLRADSAGVFLSYFFYFVS